MKFKLLRRRLSISAPKMTIKTHIPWPLRAAAVVVLLGISIALGLWAYDAGKQFAGFGVDLKAEVARLHEQVQQLTAERDQLAATSSGIESRISIERATQEQLASQIKILEAENAKLKNDLAFFENLSGGAKVAEGVTVKRFEIEPDSTPNQFHYRILLVQGGKPGKDFSGDLQLILTLQQGGKAVMMTLPRAGTEVTDANQYQVSFRFYKRLEGSFSIPADASLKQAQVRILERGTLRAQQNLSLK